MGDSEWRGLVLLHHEALSSAGDPDTGMDSERFLDGGCVRSADPNELLVLLRRGRPGSVDRVRRALSVWARSPVSFFGIASVFGVAPRALSRHGSGCRLVRPVERDFGHSGIGPDLTICTCK